MVISYISFGVFMTIRVKICSPQSQNCQNRTLHISKIGKLLPFVRETTAFETTTFLSGMQNLVKIGKELRT